MTREGHFFTLVSPLSVKHQTAFCYQTKQILPIQLTLERYSDRKTESGFGVEVEAVEAIVGQK